MAVRRSLKNGDRYAAVAVLEAVLITHHFTMGRDITPCETFTQPTEVAVKRFQAWAMSRGGIEGLKDDGEVGGKTFAAIRLYLGVDLETLPDHFWPQE